MLDFLLMLICVFGGIFLIIWIFWAISIAPIKELPIELRAMELRYQLDQEFDFKCNREFEFISQKMLLELQLTEKEEELRVSLLNKLNNICNGDKDSLNRMKWELDVLNNKIKNYYYIENDSIEEREKLLNFKLNYQF